MFIVPNVKSLWRCNMKHEEECFITYPNTEKCVEKTKRSRVFLTHFDSSECFILHLKQMRILGENWEEIWVNLYKFLTYPNSVPALISFFILWIINDFYISRKTLTSSCVFISSLNITCFKNRFNRKKNINENRGRWQLKTGQLMLYLQCLITPLPMELLLKRVTCGSMFWCSS